MRDQAADVRPPAECHLERCLFSLRRISRRQSYTGLHATVYGVIELTEIDSDLDLVKFVTSFWTTNYSRHPTNTSYT